MTFCLILRRKTTFYMVNLIIPCVSMSFLTISVFLLSSNSGEKITLCISILLALTLFFLLLLDIMPPSSLGLLEYQIKFLLPILTTLIYILVQVVPLLGKYLVFTITMVSLSICVTIYILNIHHRKPQLNKNMSKTVRTLFLKYLPRVLRMKDFIKEYNLIEFKSKILLDSSLTNLRSMEVLYTKNALLTREMSKSKLANYNESNRLLLIESDSSLRQNSAKRKIKSKLRSKCSRSDLHFQNLILHNIKYLIQIANHFQRDYNARKVELFILKQVFNFRSFLDNLNFI